MASYLLAVPAKTTKSVDYKEKFQRFIGNNYDDEPSKFSEAIKELNSLRDATVVKTPDKHETGLDLMIRCVYFGIPSIVSLINVHMHIIFLGLREYAHFN